tara:strand:+ start:2519 stop:3586 length:1068 start_codon:yes stop_codon:yes gene_type:complete
MAKYITFQPKDHFASKIWTGTGSSNAQTGVGFQPDWLWMKRRDGAEHHIVVDAVRGLDKQMYTSHTSGQDTNAQTVTAVGADGFTLGTNAQVNGNGQDFAGWLWKGANSTASNSNGSITSTVSANTTAGFSIVTWLGNNQSAQTIGHGLGEVPDVILIKEYGGASGWVMGGFGESWNAYISLQNSNQRTDSGDASTGSGRMFKAGGTEPTSTVFHHNGSAILSGNNSGMVGYFFKEKQGFSKFGTYIGNGSTWGPMVNCGFAPAFILIKYWGTGGSGNWMLFDNKRHGFNQENEFFHPNSQDAESTSTHKIAFLSNGFKPRANSSEINTNGGKMIYMAFAAEPFVASNEVAATGK